MTPFPFRAAAIVRAALLEAISQRDHAWRNVEADLDGDRTAEDSRDARLEYQALALCTHRLGQLLRDVSGVTAVCGTRAPRILG